jgi:opacity protein-like surface antigen
MFDNQFQQIRGFSFTSALAELSLKGEFNFFPFTGFDRKSIFTPYVTAGVAAAGIVSSNSSSVVFSIPFGLGAKFNAGERWNFALEWLPRRTFSDDLEGLGNAFFGPDAGAMSSKQRYFSSDPDWYFTAMFKVAFKIYGRENTCSAYRFHAGNN